MTRAQKYKNVISSFIASENGQRFFNFAYSIGAAIVIWGALFKILHLPGGNALLSIGMGTEVFMFVLTAFDRPPKEYHWEDVFPALKDPEAGPGITGANFGGGGSVVIGNVESAQLVAAPAPAAVASHAAVVPAADLDTASQQYLEQINAIAAEMQSLRNTTQALNEVSEVLLSSYRTVSENSESINASSRGYVEQMQALHKNLEGLNTIYELQLRSAASQIDAIDRVNRGIKDMRDMYEKSAAQSARYCEETEKMGRYMQQLNTMYERMIAAMSMNVYGAAAPQQPAAPSPESQNI